MTEVQEPQHQGSTPSDSPEASVKTHEKDAPEVYTFPSPYEFNSREPTTLVELRMRKLSGMIRAKPRWWEKVQDEALVTKWRAEMHEYDRERIAFEWRPYPENEGEDDFDYKAWHVKHWPPKPVTEAQLDYVFAELKYYASQVDGETGIHSTSVYCVYQSWALVSTDVKDSLIHAVVVLESVPDEEKDWHPGSNGQVLDLVHPSLFCLRIDKSHFRHGGDGADPLEEYSIEGYTELRPDFKEFSDYKLKTIVSQKYQWLPTDFEVSEAGEVECRGIINNLHPITHKVVYPAITAILQAFVPMFERVLSDALSPEPPRAIEVDPTDWYDPEPDFDNDEDYERYREEREPRVPEPAPFQSPGTGPRIDISLKGRTLQVIVKLANIMLTPEKPQYPGGTWHVEGMLNERIVATGLYYYACENITESRLAFRVQVGTDEESVDMVYENGDYDGYRSVFGFANNDPLNQELGHVVAAEDKCVAFPNIYQHRVEPFALADPTRPGHRKILCFFLVDPYREIDSTACVPPQQRAWYTDEMERASALRALPQELYDMIAEYALEGTITRKEAEEEREKLMKERSEFVLQHNEDVFGVRFNLCEH